MAEFIAVNDIFSVVDYGSLKRQALMFDRIAIPHFGATFDALHERFPDKSELFGDFDWLLERGIVFEPDVQVSEETLMNDPEYREFSDDDFDHLVHMDEAFRGISTTDLLEHEGDVSQLSEKGAELPDLMQRFFRFRIRELTLKLRLSGSFDAYPILSSFIGEPAEQEGKDAVVEIVLSEFPVPDEQTPWERIEEFRADRASQSRFFALKEWINDTARMQLDRTEIEDKLNARISDYEEHMRLHRIKVTWDTMKVIARTEAGYMTAAKAVGLAPLITVAGMITSPLFTLKQRQIKLLEAEQQALGREVAYIIKAKNTFN